MRKLRKSHVFLILFLCLLGLGAWGWHWLFADLPALDSLPERLNTPSVRILDRNGQILYEALDSQSGRHAVVSLEQIPETLIQATIATEDRAFYSHPGVDLAGALRAVWINLRGGQVLAGGSTITQQVARTLLMTESERFEISLRRKLREVFLAYRLTQRFSKDEILALYLNQSYYGGMAYGVEAAALTYFGEPVSELDLAECALLAGLPQAPALYNPFTDPEAADRRQSVVLGLMEADGWINSEQRLLAESEPLVYTEQPYPMEAPHFVMMVRTELDSLFSPAEIYAHGGLLVRTSLDLDWQHHAEAAIAHQLNDLGRSPDGLGHNVNNAALTAVDPHSGQILALVGSPDYFDAATGGAINMAISPRQPGSALKPFVYAAALDPNRADPWTAATMLLDVRTSFLTHDGEAYVPANYDQREHGPVLMRQALASSLNIPAVLALDHISLKSLFDLAGELGISTLNDPDDYDLSLALGGGEVRLLELTAAFGALANGGYRVEPLTILEISDFQGRVLYSPEIKAARQVLDPRVAWLISDILSDNDARRLGFGANSALRLERPAAVKTGTTSNFHDNWTVGYTPDLAVGVWAGNTDYRPMRAVDGLSGAAPIWHQFIRTVLSDRPRLEFEQPPGLLQVEICELSGLLPGEVCPYRRMEWFIAGTQPTQVDNFYREVILDGATGLLADANTPPERQQQQIALDLPLQTQPWARTQDLLLYSDLLDASSSSQPGGSSASLTLISPAYNSIYRLAAGLPADTQRLMLEAVGAPGLQDVRLWVDGELVVQLKTPPYQAWWLLVPGAHQAWATAVMADGIQVTSEIVLFTVE